MLMVSRRVTKARYSTNAFRALLLILNGGPLQQQINGPRKPRRIEKRCTAATAHVHQTATGGEPSRVPSDTSLMWNMPPDEK